MACKSGLDPYPCKSLHLGSKFLHRRKPTYAFPFATTSSRTSGVVLAPLFSSSPVMSCKTGIIIIIMIIIIKHLGKSHWKALETQIPWDWNHKTVPITVDVQGLRRHNIQTLKFKAQPTNAFFTVVNQMFSGSSQLLIMLSELYLTILFHYHIWLTVAKNRSVGWASNFRVCMLLKSAVNEKLVPQY